jgi:hypothetical protein
MLAVGGHLLSWRMREVDAESVALTAMPGSMVLEVEPVVLWALCGSCRRPHPDPLAKCIRRLRCWRCLHYYGRSEPRPRPALRLSQQMVNCYNSFDQKFDFFHTSKRLSTSKFVPGWRQIHVAHLLKNVIPVRKRSKVRNFENLGWTSPHFIEGKPLMNLVRDFCWVHQSFPDLSNSFKIPSSPFMLPKNANQ